MANRHKKMLSITHHLGNASLNPMRCHSHQPEWPPSKRQKEQVLARMWRQGNPRTLMMGWQVDVATMESRMKVSQGTTVLSIMLRDEGGH